MRVRVSPTCRRSIPAGKAYNFWSFGNIFIFGQDRLELRRDHGRDHGSQRPVTRVSHPYHAANRSHSSAHTPRRQTSHRAEPPPGRHPPPRTASHRGTGGWWSRPHQSEHRGARVEGPLMPYPVRCPWPLPAHTQTILVVRISRPLDALDFVNRIQKNYNCPQTIHRRQSTVSNSSLSSPTGVQNQWFDLYGRRKTGASWQKMSNDGCGCDSMAPDSGRPAIMDQSDLKVWASLSQ